MRILNKSKRKKPFIPNRDLGCREEPTYLVEHTGLPNQISFNIGEFGKILSVLKEAFDTNLYSYDEHLEDSRYVNMMPGEHYRFINALVREFRINKVVDIGTYTGLSTLAALENNYNTRVDTFDILPLQSFENHILNNFQIKGKFRQHICDLSQIQCWRKNIDILENAELIILDGPKNYFFEMQTIENFRSLSKSKMRFLLIDDIHFLNMQPLWYKIRAPKLDLTNFVHWSGTGLVDISNPQDI